jgi:hypothetical protein
MGKEGYMVEGEPRSENRHSIQGKAAFIGGG